MKNGTKVITSVMESLGVRVEACCYVDNCSTVEELMNSTDLLAEDGKVIAELLINDLLTNELFDEIRRTLRTFNHDFDDGRTTRCTMYNVKTRSNNEKFIEFKFVDIDGVCEHLYLNVENLEMHTSQQRFVDYLLNS